MAIQKANIPSSLLSLQQLRRTIHDGLLIWEVEGMNRKETRKALVDIIQTMFSGLLAHTN